MKAITRDKGKLLHEKSCTRMKRKSNLTTNISVFVDLTLSGFDICPCLNPIQEVCFMFPVYSQPSNNQAP
jgi:hypothetical protein